VVFSLVLEFYLKLKQNHKIELFFKKMKFKTKGETTHKDLLSIVSSTAAVSNTTALFLEIIGFENVW